MTKNLRTTIALATTVVLAMGTAAIAQTATPDAKPPVKKTVRHHAHKSAPPASDMYLRAAGSEPAPKVSR